MKYPTLAVLLLTLLFCNPHSVLAQDTTQAINAAIVAEGRRLYQSEMASWYGTDIFLERFKDQRANIGGYFSYSEGPQSTCVFFSKEEVPTVLATITFDSTYAVNRAQVDGTPRSFSTLEQDLYTLRLRAIEDISRDTLYRSYNNTLFNLIPLIHKGERKVYVLTGPKENGVVLLGNDYLLTFDANNTLTARRPLHKSLITMEYGKVKDMTVTGGMHTHLPEFGDFMTPTDICTLMLYARRAGWQQHTVVSKNYISIWDCEKNLLISITREAMDRIEEDQKKRRKNK